MVFTRDSSYISSNVSSYFCGKWCLAQEMLSSVFKLLCFEIPVAHQRPHHIDTNARPRQSASEPGTRTSNREWKVILLLNTLFISSSLKDSKMFIFSPIVPDFVTFNETLVT